MARAPAAGAGLSRTVRAILQCRGRATNTIRRRMRLAAGPGLPPYACDDCNDKWFFIVHAGSRPRGDRSAAALRGESPPRRPRPLATAAGVFDLCRALRYCAATETGPESCSTCCFAFSASCSAGWRSVRSWRSAALAAVIAIYGTDLPDTAQLERYEPPTLSRIYSGEGALMDEFARERRIFTPIDEIPDQIKQAFISAEDKNFYSHHGFDPAGIAAALYDSAVNGDRLRGASTITQQVMKNFLLTGDRSGERKIKEIILATRLEITLDKDEILELYLNEIFLGQNSYGVTAAAQVYFGKSLDEVTLAEAAYLAALPQAPSVLHPVREKPRAIARRNYVLDQMAENGYITREVAEAAKAEDLLTVQSGDRVGPRLAAAARLFHRRDPPPALGQARRRGAVHRRPARSAPPSTPSCSRWPRRRCATGSSTTTAASASTAGRWRRSTPPASTRPTRRAGAARSATPRCRATSPAGTRRSSSRSARARRASASRASPEDADGHFLAFADAELGARCAATTAGCAPPQGPDDMWDVGDVVLVKAIEADGETRWSYRQIPAIQGGFMAMDTETGRVLAMQGGFSYQSSVFNRATQALRQPGSSFKPFVYAAALDNGYSPATIVLDAPIEVATGAGIWTPENAGGKYYGPTPIRTGLEQSRNLMTVRIAQDIGMDTVAEYAERFGIYDDMPRLLSYSLGAGETTLYKMVDRLRRDRQRRPAGRADARRPGAGPLRPHHLPPRPARLRGLRRRRRRRRRPADDPLERRADHGRDHRLPDHLDAAGRREPRHQRQLGRPARPQPRRQDRHHQRGQGRLVHRLQPAHRRRLLHGLRHPAPARRERLRRHALRADLRRVHQGGDGGAGAGEMGGAAGRLLHQDRPRHRPAPARQRQRPGRASPSTSRTAR